MRTGDRAAALNVADRRRPIHFFRSIPSHWQRGSESTRAGLWTSLDEHRDTHVLCEEARESIKEAAIKFAVTVFESPDHEREAYDEADRLFCVTVHEGRHGIEFALAEQQNISASRTKKVDAAEEVCQSGAVVRLPAWRDRKAKEATRRRFFTELLAELLNPGA